MATDGDAVEQTDDWRIWTRIGFRFGFCYFGLFGLAGILGLIPILLAGAGIHVPWADWLNLFHVLRPTLDWVGTHVLGLHVVSMQVGSDSAFQWTALFVLVVVAAVATAVWSVLDRRRPHYHRLQVWLWVYLRFVLATAMFYFGMAKAIPTQMPFVLSRLVEPYGNFSPEGVLWSQVSVSQPYEILLGIAELLGGLLLLAPRTTTAGAVLCAIDMTQVLVLNLTYDIRLKTVSSQLLLLSMFLLAPRARRLATALFSDRTVPKVRPMQLFATRRANRLALGVQLAAGLLLLSATGAQNWQQWTRPATALYGIYQVDGFSTEGYKRDPLLTDQLRWRRVVVDNSFHVPDHVIVTIQHMDDSFEEYGGDIDPRKHVIELRHRIELGTFRETPVRVHLTYWWPSPDRMVIDAKDYAGHRIHAWFTKQDPKSFPLVERGFSWVQETGYNR